MNGTCNIKLFFCPAPWGPEEGSKGQIFNFKYKVNFKDFYTKLCVCSHKCKIQKKKLYQTLCVFLQMKDRKNIKQNFDSVAGVMPQGWDLGVLGGSKL